jgi:heme-degrading monooxygenase HmoA
MFARVTRYEGSPSEIEAGIKLIKETIAPAAKRLQGFKGGYWLLDRTGGKGFSVTIFESEAALHATEDDAAQLRSRASSVVKITSVERYEVVAEANVEELAPTR